MSTKNLAQFLQEVHPCYWETADKETQIRLAVELGTHLGYDFTKDQMEYYIHNQKTGNVKLLQEESDTRLVRA